TAPEASTPSKSSAAKPATSLALWPHHFDSLPPILLSSLFTTVRASPDRSNANDGVRPRRSGQARTDQLSAVLPLPLPYAGRPSSLPRSARPQEAEPPNLPRPSGLLAAVVAPIARSYVRPYVWPSGPPNPLPLEGVLRFQQKAGYAPVWTGLAVGLGQAAEGVLRRGSTTVNVEPTPGAERTESEPSICSTILREM